LRVHLVFPELRELTRRIHVPFIDHIDPYLNPPFNVMRNSFENLAAVMDAVLENHTLDVQEAVQDQAGANLIPVLAQIVAGYGAHHMWTETSFTAYFTTFIPNILVGTMGTTTANTQLIYRALRDHGLATGIIIPG